MLWCTHSPQYKLSPYSSSKFLLLMPNTTPVWQSMPAVSRIKNARETPLGCRSVSSPASKYLGQLYTAMILLEKKGKLHSSKKPQVMERVFHPKMSLAPSAGSKSHCGPVYSRLSAQPVISFPKVAYKKNRKRSKTSWLQILWPLSPSCFCQFYTVLLAVTFMLYSTTLLQNENR